MNMRTTKKKKFFPDERRGRQAGEMVGGKQPWGEENACGSPLTRITDVGSEGGCGGGLTGSEKER